MFEIIITICLSGSSDCTDLLVPQVAEDRGRCEQVLDMTASEWVEVHGGGTILEAHCVAPGSVTDVVTPFAIEEIADGVFVHRGKHAIPSRQSRSDLSNLGFVIGKDSVAVIDAGASYLAAQALYSAIRVRTDLPISYLFLTHMHPDHVLGAGFFRAAGAEVIGHANLGNALANRRDRYEEVLAELLGPKEFLGSRVVQPDRAAEPGEVFDLGGRSITTQTYPTAHTDNDLTVTDVRTGTLFAGDLVFAEHTPALDGSILGWQAVLDDMAATDVQRVVPGHGPASLDWPDGGDAVRGYLAALTAEVRAAINAGESMTSAITYLGESQRDNWVLFDEFNARNATAAFKELEWE